MTRETLLAAPDLDAGSQGELDLLVDAIDDLHHLSANSALLCEPHHTKVHHGFRVERDPGGRWRTYRPDDTEIVIVPAIT